MNKNKKKKNIGMTIAMVLILGAIIFSFFGGDSKYESITESQAIEKLQDVDSVMYADGVYTLKTNDGTYTVTPVDTYEFRQVLFDNNIEVNEVDVTRVTFLDKLLKVVIAVIIGIIVFGIINIISSVANTSAAIKEMMNAPKKDGDNKGTSPFGGIDMSSISMGGKNMSLNIKREVPNVKFSDVAGIDEVAREVKTIVSFLQNPYKYQKMGARMPKGAILYGNPGTGKTLIAKAIAGEAGVPFLSVSGSDFMEMYVGVGAKRVRELFDAARKCAPCIVFIDEIDAIGGKRGQSQSSERDQTINAILTEMDGFVGSEGIFVLAATNRLDMLDPAIIRAGRFDKHVAVSLPDKDARLAILKLHARNKMLDETVDLEAVAKQTVGFAGADLENLLNEATILAVGAGKNAVSNTEIDRAFFKVVMQGDVKDGQTKRGKKELELVAWHEAGHTLITKLLTNDDVTRVTILASTSGAGGVTFHSPKEGEFHSKQDLKNRIAIAYGGRAAEEILFGDHDHVTVGASSDIQSASQQIKDYIMKYGMSEKFGMLDIGAFDYQSMSNDDIIDEAAKLANEVYKYTLNTLLANKDKLQAIAEALMEKESLLDTEINSILGIDNSSNEEEVVAEAAI